MLSPLRVRKGTTIAVAIVGRAITLGEVQKRSKETKMKQQIEININREKSNIDIIIVENE